MSFAVIHMQKIKTGGIRGIQNHNERLKESQTNPDIDTEKSHLNMSLHTEDSNKSYYNRVKDRIKELNLPKAVRKDAVTMCGFVCTSDKEFFDKLPKAEQDRFFKESHDFLKNRYGEKNVIASNIHYDEKTPHLHCYITPVTDNGRLSAKSIFTKVELQTLQTDYHKHMNERGFELERGLDSNGKRKHLDTKEFKLQTKQQEIEKTKNELDKTLNKLKTQLKSLREADKSLNDLEHLEAKKSFLGGKITLSEGDYNKVIDMAKKSVFNSREIKRVTNENVRLKDENENFRDASYKSINKVSELRGENKKLKIELKDFKKLESAMYSTLKEHDLLSEVAEKIKETRETEKVAQKAFNKSHSMGRER